MRKRDLWYDKPLRNGTLRLCNICLKNRRRCCDSYRPYRVKGWKNYRSKQYRPLAAFGKVVTPADTKVELERLERRLARRLGLCGRVRATLIELDRKGALVEDRTVADWHDALSAYLDGGGVLPEACRTT